MSAKKYIVKTPVNHDNKPYEIGDRIDLEDEAAAGLLEVKAIELGVAEVDTKKSAAAADTGGTPDTPAPAPAKATTKPTTNKK